MGIEFTKTKIGKVIAFNPPERVELGAVVKKIAMGDVTERTRMIQSFSKGEYSGGPKFRNGDTILAKITPCLENGKTAFVDILNEGEIATGSTEFIVLRATEQTNSKFIYYLVISPNFRKRAISCMDGTSGRKRVNEAVLKSHLSRLPSVKEQEKIAAVLSAFDDKIELNNKINAELEQMAKTLYDYWFVQFDFPDANGKPYKTSGGKMVYNEKLKREIPEGWRSGTLSDISELIRGVSYDKNDIKTESDDGVIPVLRATNISGNIIDLENMVYVPTKNVSAEQLLHKYDILMTMSSGSKNHIGKNAFFYFDKKVAFGAFCAKLVAKNDFQFYLYSYTQSDFMFATIHNECLGTNINNLNGTLVNGFRIVIPPNDLVSRFNKEMSPIYQNIGNNLVENQKLAELRDWLLPMLMNGQVKVK